MKLLCSLRSRRTVRILLVLCLFAAGISIIIEGLNLEALARKPRFWSPDSLLIGFGASLVLLIYWVWPGRADTFGLGRSPETPGVDRLAIYEVEKKWDEYGPKWTISVDRLARALSSKGARLMPDMARWLRSREGLLDFVKHHGDAQRAILMMQFLEQDARADSKEVIAEIRHMYPGLIED